MIPPYHGAAFLLISFAVSLISLYKASTRKSSLVALAAAVALSFIFAYATYGSSDIGIAYVGVGISALAVALADTYLRKPTLFIGLLAILAIGFAYGILAQSATIALAGMFAIGTIAGLLHNDFFSSKAKVSSEFNRKLRIEIRRDVVHIMIGILVVAIVLLFPLTTATDSIFFLILLGYLINDASGLRYSRKANTVLYNFYARTHALERIGTTYGLGAIYLAAGVALLLGFIHSTSFLLFSIVALLFADPAATILGAGVEGPRMPYNKRKSVIGSLTFFMVTAFLGYLVIGFNAFVAAAILTFVESLDTFVDDNISIAVVCTAIYLLVYL